MEETFRLHNARETQVKEESRRGGKKWRRRKKREGKKTKMHTEKREERKIKLLRKESWEMERK